MKYHMSAQILNLNQKGSLTACEMSPRAHGSKVSHANETNVNHFSTRQLERFLHLSDFFGSARARYSGSARKITLPSG